MKNQAKVVVIGGGVVGVSVLYHLTKAGWRDVMLIERAELTSGSTWHAAGGMHTVNGDPNVAKLQQYTINLYRELEQISGQSCGLHITGGLMLAGTPERLDWLKMTVARGRYLGMDLELIDMTETKKRFPLLDEKHFVGAIYDPIEGHVDPYGVTHAYAKSAQIGGAEIVRQNRVVDLKQGADGSWDVITEHGNVHAVPGGSGRRVDHGARLRAGGMARGNGHRARNQERKKRRIRSLPPRIPETPCFCGQSGPGRGSFVRRVRGS